MTDLLTVEIWAAVDKLTKPTRQKVQRAGDASWLDELAEATNGACNVPAYRAATAGYAVIPSLWDQATIALHGGEQQVGRGSKPLRERSIADLDLMEIRSLIRDTIRRELEQRGSRTSKQPNGRSVDFNPAEVRSLASKVIAEGGANIAGSHTDGLEFWAYRFAQWARLLETYLRAAEHQARPVRLRNSACPTCRTRQVTVELDGENMIVPALVIEFNGGYVRSCRCEACGDGWLRADLEDLAAQLGVGFPLSDPDERITA